MIKLLCLVAVIGVGVVSGEKNVICYYGTWATYRWGVGKFDVSHINTNLCTHIVYTFVGLNNDGVVISLDPYLDLPDNWGRDNFGAFNRLKENAPHLKTILAVGGWNEGSAKFSVMAASASLRRNFIDSALKMVQDYGFDGLDVDWEYPNRRDTVHGAADIENYILLLKELREEFDKHGLILSAAVASVRDMASLSYNIPEMSKYLDFINVMTYDMYGAWDPVTGHNAPLHSGLGDQGKDPKDLYTVDVALQYWLDEGAPPEKLVIGVPFYGRTFRLVDPNNGTVRAPANGPGLAGPFTVTNGFMGYNEFCYKLITETWNQWFDPLAKVPFATADSNWVSYDDVDSITTKIDYVMKYNINGIMIWSIETDDFHGLCGQGEYPLLKAVNKAVGRNVEDITSSSSTAAPSSSTTVTSTTSGVPSSSTSSPSSSTTTASSSSAAPSSSSVAPSSPVTSAPASSPEPEVSSAPGNVHYVCSNEGIDGNPCDCRTFFICIKDEDGNMKATKFHCPEPLLFDINNKVCDYPHLAVCAT